MRIMGGSVRITGGSRTHNWDKAMVTGQGRWGLYVKRPSAMIEYYRQASLQEKLATTDLAKETRTTRAKKE